MSAAEYRALLEKQSGERNKFSAQRTEVDGISFASKREAKRMMTFLAQRLLAAR